MQQQNSMITVYFRFNDSGKEVWLDIDENVMLQECIDALRSTYEWAVYVPFQSCNLKRGNKQGLDFKQTLKNLEIENQDTIIVINTLKDKNKNEQNNQNNQNLAQINNEINGNQGMIVINFQVSYKGYVSDPVDLGKYQFRNTQMLEEVLVNSYFGGIKDKLIKEAKDLNLVFYCDSAPASEQYNGILEDDLNITLEDYLKKNNLAGTNFKIYYFDPDVIIVSPDKKVDLPRRNK